MSSISPQWQTGILWDLSATLGNAFIDYSVVSHMIPTGTINANSEFSFWQGLLDQNEQYLLQPILHYYGPGVAVTGGFAKWAIWTLLYTNQPGPYPFAPYGLYSPAYGQGKVGILNPPSYPVLVSQITRNNSTGGYKAEWTNDSATQLYLLQLPMKFSKFYFMFENMSTNTTYQDALNLGTLYANWFQLHTTAGYPPPQWTLAVTNPQWNPTCGTNIIDNPAGAYQFLVLDCGQ